MTTFRARPSLLAFAVVILVGCGGSQPAASQPGSTSNEGSDSVDPAIAAGAGTDCASDEDCVIAPFEACCTNPCPYEVGPQSRAAIDAARERCAVVECTVIETLACQSETPPPPMRAVCESGACVAR